MTTINESIKFMSEGSSWYVTTMTSLMTIDKVKVDQDHVIKGLSNFMRESQSR